MRTTALLLAVVLCVGPSPARAEPQLRKQRGALTGVGFGFLIGSLGAVGLGVAGTLSANSAASLLDAYPAVLTNVDDARSVQALISRRNENSSLAGVGFGVAAAFLALSIIFFAIDAPKVNVAFVPTSQGGVFALSARF